jgi:hypothetical protein
MRAYRVEHVPAIDAFIALRTGQKLRHTAKSLMATSYPTVGLILE